MELDELKTGINSRLEDGMRPAPVPTLTRIPRSHSPLVRIQRNIRIELALYLFCAIGYVVLSIQSPDLAFKVYIMSVVIVCLPILWVLYAFHRRISVILPSADTVRDSISDLLSALKRYRRIYLYLSTLLVPFFVLYMILLDYLIGGVDGPSDPDMYSDRLFWGVMIAVTALSTLAVYFLNRLYIHWMYGRHISELEATLADFDDVVAE
jgi:hypothetical protein